MPRQGCALSKSGVLAALKTLAQICKILHAFLKLRGFTGSHSALSHGALKLSQCRLPSLACSSTVFAHLAKNRKA